MKLLIFSDIHGDAAALQKLMDIEADYYFAAGDLANWGRGLDKLGPILAQHGDRVYAMPGNHESDVDIAKFCETFGLQDFHGQSMKLGRYTVAGLGYSNPTPFKTPGEYTEQQIAERLARFSGLSPMILICHCPPLDTKLDRAGEKQHFGSRAIRTFIEKEQPEYFFCGHIHEAAGQSERFGQTQGVNAGKKGYLLELD